jgi:hypothetical protein
MFFYLYLLGTFGGKKIRGFFERRGREGYAESAEGIPKKERRTAKILRKKRIAKINKTSAVYLNIFWYFFFIFFCNLCATFASSAFKKCLKKGR